MSESVYERVKKRAYEIWEEEGRPWGRDAVHWEQAHRELAAAAPAEPAEAAPKLKAKPKTAKSPAKRPAKKAAG